ncbi:MAG: hypothetical protein FWF31_02300 [Desulfobulbus sp.]|nr:hypothetical protein [Desulfobulbus sp.]
MRILSAEKKPKPKKTGGHGREKPAFHKGWSLEDTLQQLHQQPVGQDRSHRDHQTADRDYKGIAGGPLPVDRATPIESVNRAPVCSSMMPSMHLPELDHQRHHAMLKA